MQLGANVIAPSMTPPPSQKAAIGKRIVARREALGLTQDQLAARINLIAGRQGTTTATVSRWENGHSTPSRLLGELCAALEMGSDELLSGELPHPAAEQDRVKLAQLRKLLSDDDLAYVPPGKIAVLARLLEGVDVEAWRAKAALEMLFPRPTKRQ